MMVSMYTDESVSSTPSMSLSWIVQALQDGLPVQHSLDEMEVGPEPVPMAKPGKQVGGGRIGRRSVELIMITLGRQSLGGVFWRRICMYRVNWVITPWKMAARSSTSSRGLLGWSSTAVP